MKKLLYIILILFLASPVLADDIYFVSESGAGGQDGTAIGDAWSWANFKDSGNWSATEDNAKIDPGDTVCLSGAIDTGSGTNVIPGGGSGGNYVTLDGSGTGDCAAASAATLSHTTNESSTDTIMSFTGRDYIKFKSITLSGTAYIAVYLESGDYFEFDDITLNGAFYYGIYNKTVGYLTVKNSSFTGTYDSTGDGIYGRGLSNSAIHNNSFIDWGHVAIVADTYTDGGISHDIDIYFNKFTMPTAAYGRALGLNGASGGQSNQIWFHHNWTDGLRQMAVQIDNGSYIYIYRNVFANQLNICQSADDDGCTYKYYYWNGDHTYQGGHIIAIDSFYGNPDHVYFQNNTIYKASEHIFRVTATGAVSVVARNNIFMEGGLANDTAQPPGPPGSTDTTYDVSTFSMRDDYTISSFNFQHNIIYSTETDWFRYGNTTYTALNTFEAAVAGAQDNLADNPDMTDPGSDDFTLLDESPCVDAGIVLQSAPADAFLKFYDAWDPETAMPPNDVDTVNANFYGSTWDIGAYEYDDPNENPPAGVIITPDAAGAITITPDAGGAITITY